MSLLRIAERYAAWWAHAILESIAPLDKLPSLDDLAAQQLADKEAEEEVAEPVVASDGEFHEGSFYDPEMSSTDGAVTDPAVECSPAAAASATSAAAGHPNRDQRKLYAVAAFGLSEWMKGEPCDAPTYFRSLIHDLEQLAK